MDKRLSQVIGDCMEEVRKAHEHFDSGQARADHERAQAEQQARWKRDDERRLREERARRIYDSGICLDAADVPLVVAGNVGDTPAVEHVRRWLEPPDGRRILVLCGGVGIGKTLAAALVIAEHGGYCIRAPQLAQRIDPWKSDTEAGHEVVPLTTHTLVLDDLGTERDPNEPRFAEALGRFVDERQQHGRTIITSNLRRAQFRERYDARVIDRLNQCAKAVELAGKSLRRAGGGF